MGKYGIKGIEMEWFQSYMKYRRKFCRVNGKDSETRSIEIGVVQGSCLGPLFFLLFINELLLSIKHCQATICADDNTISFFH